MRPSCSLQLFSFSSPRPQAPNPHFQLPLGAPLILYNPQRPLHGSLKPAPPLRAFFPGVPLLVAQERNLGCFQPGKRLSCGPQAVPVLVPPACDYVSLRDSGHWLV